MNPTPELQRDAASASDWFAARGWQPFAFQREVWAAMAAGRSGLLHATTGSGKTYAVWFGALMRGAGLLPLPLGEQPYALPLPPEEGWGEGSLAEISPTPTPTARQPAPGARVGKTNATFKPGKAPPLGVLWITPMRALAADTTRALQFTLADAAPHITVGQRTGDTPAAERARQDRRMPTALVTTPESLSLMLTRERAAEELAGVHTVIVDEWHELMGSKRGVQVQLALARLKTWHPGLVVWGLSATLGNLTDAMQVLLGVTDADTCGTIVQGRVDKTLLIDTLLPANPGRFSWGGHLGAQMLQPVIAEIESARHTLVFTNTRSQAEIWYQLLLRERPDWAGIVALHHGSLDKSVREWVEAGLKQGQLKAVVCTSSLDLGVDFLPVERVLQIGSAKGVARLLQRAGRSGHAPGRPSRITLVPTNTLELIEAAAARRAAQAGRIEKRATPDKPLDVLVQHLVTVALGTGFTAAALFAEVRTAHAYKDLTPAEFQWALDFVEGGGGSLAAYPEYHRLQAVDGIYRVPDRQIAKRHKLAIGTIVSDSSMHVKYLSGGRIGSIEEGFIARLRKGDCFVFAGRVLEYLRTQDMTAYVQRATKNKGVVPSWAGGKMPLSTELADAVLELLAVAAAAPDNAVPVEPEMIAALPMLQTQARLSALPTPAAVLVETIASREGHHIYLYPFAGRNVHLGLGSLLAWRLARVAPNTFSVSVNDYGFELLSAEPVDLAALSDGRLFDTTELLADVLHSLNSGELAQRRFREIARVAGLIFTGYPGAPKSTKQLQASSSLFFEVFKKYDASNLLLTQAQTEVLSQELNISQLRSTLERLKNLPLTHVALAAPSPFSLPLMVERLREKLSTEKLADRLARIVKDAETAADKIAAKAMAKAPVRRPSPSRPR